MAAEKFSGKAGRAGRIGKAERIERTGRVGRNGCAEIINKFFFCTLTYFLYFCRRLIRGAVTG